MKENYQIYLPYQIHWRPQSAGRDPPLSHKKMKTPFRSNMSKSRRLTLTFFPTSTTNRIHEEEYGLGHCREVDKHQIDKKFPRKHF